MKKHILIIEDDKEISELFELILETEGYLTTVLNRAPEPEYINNLEINLILLDVRLAGSKWDGNELCRMFKSQYPQNKTPILLISAERDLERKALACGADDFLTKPFDLAELITRAGRLII